MLAPLPRARAISGHNIPARAIRPAARPVCLKKWRRLRWRKRSWKGSIRLILVQRFVEIEQQAGDHGVSGGFRWVQIFINRRFTHRDQLLCGLRILCVFGSEFREGLRERFLLDLRWVARGYSSETEVQAIINVATVPNNAFAEMTRGFHILRIVHRHQSLQRSIGALAAEAEAFT